MMTLDESFICVFAGFSNASAAMLVRNRLDNCLCRNRALNNYVLFAGNQFCNLVEAICRYLHDLRKKNLFSQVDIQASILQVVIQAKVL